MRIAITLDESYHGARRTIQIPEIGADGRPSQQRRKLEIRIPKGIQEGQKIRLSGQGQMGRGGAPRGNLLLEVEFQRHPLFHAEGSDIAMVLPLAPWEAALGGKVTVPTLGGNVELKIASGSQSGQKMRLKGRGLPGNPPGDQLLTLQIHLPAAENREIEELYEALREKSSFNPRNHLGE